jgi:NADH-dependent peroxiredoxin subunit F
MYDLIILGGGPAGLTAAVYAVRKRLNCLLISPDLGGKANVRMMIPGIDSFRVINGAEIVSRFRNEIEYLDFSRVLEKAVRLDVLPTGFAVTTDSGHRYDALTVILATGVDPIRLDVPGVERFFLRGLSYSAISYAPLYVEKRAAVIGSGPMAIRSVAELAQIAAHVYLLAPADLPDGAEPSDLDSALTGRLRNRDNVTVLEKCSIAALQGDGQLRRVEVVDAAGSLQSLDVDVAFVEFGLRPRTDLIQGNLALDPRGRVVVNSAAETNIPGLFAAGDVTQLPAEQVLIAIGEGAKAALGAHEYLLRLEDQRSA